MTIALESALSGLRIAQQQLGIISTNIANAQTPGYSRKILPQSVRSINNEGVGVVAEPAIRKVDVYLSRDLWTQISAVSAQDTKLVYLDKIQQFHGDPAAGRAISAQIAALKDSFSSLSDDPTSSFQLNATLANAEKTAEKFNDFAKLITQLRNDADNEIGDTVDKINGLLKQIADLNSQVQAQSRQNASSATMSDLRDNAVKELSQYMNVSFFTRGDGVVVVQTQSGGVELAGETANELYFQKTNIGSEKFYPDTINGVYIGGDPTTNLNAYDILPFNPGGKLGALVETRDEIMPQYQAQLDELAYRTAQRFDHLGLRLFTDGTHQIPADTAPVPNPPGPLASVPYTGFATKMSVNQNIIDDVSLLQKGTTGDLIQTGSNEVIRRVLEFAFSGVEYQSVTGTRDIRVSANPAGDTLQENFGLWSQNTLVSTKNTAQYGGDMNVAPGHPFGTGPVNDDFTLRFFDARLGVNTGNVTIDLTTAAANYPIGSAGVGAGIGTVDNAAEQVASYINSLVWPADMGVAASVNSYGQLTVFSRGNIEIGAGDMGAAGLSFLGLSAGTYNTTDPYFDVQVGNDPPVRITLEPGETETDLVNKIDAVPGIATADIVINGSGHLSFRPQRGGDIRVIGGPFTSDAAGFSTAGGLGIVAEIFGSGNPVVDHAHAAFRSTNLGPGVNQSTRIITATSIVDYGQKMVNVHSQDHINATNVRDNEESYRATLEKKLVDESGVNIDEELALMIVVQTAYAAAARAVTTVQELFDDLLNAFR